MGAILTRRADAHGSKALTEHAYPFTLLVMSLKVAAPVVLEQGQFGFVGHDAALEGGVDREIGQDRDPSARP